jgi:hypothetical protein
VNWWRAYHGLLSGAMTGQKWTAAEIGRLTIPQFLCLLNERPPGQPGPQASLADFEAYLETQEAERRRWRGEG